MRAVCLVLGIFFSTLLFAQSPKFITVSLTPETSPGSCDASIHIDASRLKQPVQAFFYSGFHIGNELDVNGLCSGAATVIELFDSACVRVRLNVYISPDSANQVMLDTIYATLPTTPGGSDGSMYFDLMPTNLNTLNIFQKNTGSSYSINTLDTVFNSLDEGEYTFMVVDSVLFIDSLQYVEYFMVDVNFQYSTPSPCDHSFDMNVYQVPATPGNCDASISLIPTVGTTLDYSFLMTGYGADGYPFVNSTDGGFTFDSYGINICPQPVVVEANQNAISNGYYFFNRVYFMGVDSSGTFSWTPPIIPSGLDTVLFSAIQACSIDYSIPPDTAYVDTLIFIGADCYLVTVVLIQDSITGTSTGVVYADTSGAFIIDFSFYCPDTVFARSPSTDFASIRNFVYFGDSSGSSNINKKEKNLNEVLVYPNPACNKLKVSSSQQQLEKIEIIDLSGQTLISIIVKNNKNVEIDLSGIPSAIYIVKYVNDKEYVGFSRFVKM